MANFNRDNRDNRSGPRRDSGRRDFGNRGYGGGGDNRRREMFKAVCANCGKDCEVPFEPRDGRPVFCSDCFEKKDSTGSQAPRNFQDRGPRRPEFERREEHRSQNNELLESINHKLDKILEMLSSVSSKEEKVVSTEDKKKSKVIKKKNSTL